MAISLCTAMSASATYQAATGIDAFTFNEYWDSQLHDYGTAVTWTVGAGGSYAGIDSEITSLSGTAAQVGGSTARGDLSGWWWPITAGDLNNDAGVYTPFLGTNASILAGTNDSGSSTTVSMSWRNRTDIEVDNRGYPGIPLQRPPTAYDSYGMASDIVQLTGTPGTYVLEIEYAESALVFDDYPNFTKTEATYASNGFLYVGWFEDVSSAGGGNVPTQEWVNAVDGNSAVGGSAVANFQGSYADFLISGLPNAGDLSATLGSWGVDTTDNTVWAIIDHNSEFGAVPEPASLSLLAVGALLIIRRRRG